MAITRAQQAKQMLQNGGMSLQDAKDMAPKGEFLAYINRKEADMLKKAGGSGAMTKTGIPSFTSDTGPGGGATDTGAGHTGDTAGPGGQGRGRDLDFQQRGMSKADYATAGDRGQNFGGRGRIQRAIDFIMAGPPRGFNPATRDGAGLMPRNQMPLWMQLGYSSEEEYNTAMGRGAATTSEPPVDLNRIAYRLMADGGAVIDDEPRQAYGLGSIVKKATRAIKKVAKSDIGKIALLYAGTAGLSYLGAGAGAQAGGFGGFLRPSNFGTNLLKSGQNLGLLKRVTGTANMGTRSIRDGFLQKAFSKIPGGVTTGILAASALPLFMGGEEQEEEAELSPYLGEGLDIADIRSRPRFYQGQAYRLMAEGGDTEDAKEPVAEKVMPLIDMDGKEKDYRETGGFVDMGRMEKADDVPARLSKNEFVFRADAVRNAGDGSVDKGAEVMYNMMKNLEAGGEVSEESQGLEGARKMFKTSQRLEEVL